MANRKNRIEKNRSIEEMMGEKTEIEETITMEEVIAQMDKRQSEKDKKAKQARKSFTKRIQRMAERKDNEFAEQKRKTEQLRAINKVQQRDER